MKILKIFIFSILCIVLVAIVGAVIFIKTFNVNRYKPQILSQAKAVLSREVNFDKLKLDISLTQGISVKITDLAIAEDPSFAKGDFLTVKNVSLGLDVFAFLSQKRVLVPNLSINSPVITIIRNKDGSVNASTLAKPAPGTAVNGPGGNAAEQAKDAPALPPLLISAFKIADGKVIYIDHSFEPAIQLEVNDLNVLATGLSLTDAFPFTGEASVLSRKKNIRLQGKAFFDMDTNEVTISEAVAKSDLSDLALLNIPQALPMLQAAVLPVYLKGMLDIALDKMVAGPKGLTALSAGVDLSDGEMQFKELASAITRVAVNAKISESDVIINNFSALIAEGRVTGSGKIRQYSTKQSYEFTGDIQYLKLQQLLAQDKFPVKFEGLLSGNLKMYGKGFSPEAVSSNLAGEGKVSVQQAKLKDLNVLRTVIDKVAVIPQLGDKIAAALDGKYKQRLEQKDTQFSHVELPWVLENGKLIVKDTLISAEDFSLMGKTEAGFNGAFLLEGEFLVSQGLSAAMATAVPELQYLQNDNKQLYLPLKVTGKAGEMKFNVDAEYIAKKLLSNQAKTQLMNIIDKAMKKDTSGQQPAANGSGQAVAPAEQGAAKADGSLTDIVSGVLGSIMKNK